MSPLLKFHITIRPCQFVDGVPVVKKVRWPEVCNIEFKMADMAKERPSRPEKEPLGVIPTSKITNLADLSKRIW